MLLNGLPALKRKTGVGHYTAELAAALARAAELDAAMRPAGQPPPPELDRMAAAWIAWGVEQGHLPA